MNKLIIGNNTGLPVLAYGNGLLCYVYGRVTLNTDWFLFLLPSIFYLFHQAIEVSIKTLLKIKGVQYPDRGMKGHRLYPLLQRTVGCKLFSKSVNDLLSNKDLVELLQAMDTSYTSNKYEFPGYNLVDVPLRELVDDMIYILFEEINLILKSKNHALAVLNVPESVEKMFLHKLQKPFSYTVLGLRAD